MIGLRHIAKAYRGDEFVIRDFNLEVSAGEFLALLGPSGCGKTTLLRLIAGLETPDRGEILIDGRDVTHVPAEQRPVNTVFQNYALFPHMTVGQNIAFALKIRKFSKIEIQTAVQEILNKVHLSGYENRWPRELSGGQKQRVALARALVNKPKVLLLDEPMAALDENLRRKMQLELKELQRDLGITFIMVTHDQDEALAMADRVALLNAGSLEQIGTPAELYNHPRSEFAARFVGENNFFNFEKVAGGMYLYQFELGRLEIPGVRKENFRAAVRPESIKLHPTAETALFSVQVQSVIFKGATIVMNGRAAQGIAILAEFSSTAWPAIREGDTVYLSFSAGDVIVLED